MPLEQQVRLPEHFRAGLLVHHADKLRPWLSTVTRKFSFSKINSKKPPVCKLFVFVFSIAQKRRKRKRPRQCQADKFRNRLRVQGLRDAFGRHVRALPFHLAARFRKEFFMEQATIQNTGTRDAQFEATLLPRRIRPGRSGDRHLFRRHPDSFPVPPPESGDFHFLPSQSALAGTAEYNASLCHLRRPRGKRGLSSRGCGKACRFSTPSPVFSRWT